jgi:signal transduction histidine kinase
MSVDRRRFMEVGGFPLTRGSQDWGLLLRLAKAGTIFALRDPLVYYRSPVFADDTLSSKYRWQILSIAEIVRTLLDKDERLLVAGLRRRLVLQHLLRADRRQLARRILAGVVAHELKAPNHSLALLASIALPRKLSFQLHVSVDKIRAYVFRSVNSAASKRLAVRLDHDHFQL